MKSKKCLSYITIAAIFVLTSIFVGMHMTGAKDSSAHTQLIISQKQSPKYSEFSLGRDRGKTHQVMLVLDNSAREDKRNRPEITTSWKDSGLLSAISPRGPPGVL
jgi:hypothetical protein